MLSIYTSSIATGTDHEVSSIALLGLDSSSYFVLLSFSNLFPVIQRTKSPKAIMRLQSARYAVRKELQAGSCPVATNLAVARASLPFALTRARRSIDIVNDEYIVNTRECSSSSQSTRPRNPNPASRRIVQELKSISYSRSYIADCELRYKLTLFLPLQR